MAVYLQGLATAVPDYLLPQDEVVDRARRILGPKYPFFEKLVPAFRSAGIETRHSMAPFDWFETPKTWTDRNSLYVSAGTRLYADAARAALADAGLSAADVDIAVTVSSTGIATPTLEARAAAELGFRADLRRVPVFGLGCAGGVAGMEIARAMAAASPGATVLLVSLEGCTLSFRSDRLTKADVIATVLFGDGAAAAVLGAAPGPRGQITLEAGAQHTWPDTLQIMGWDVDDTGLGVVFDRSIPEFAEREFAPAAGPALKAMGVPRDAIDRFVCHPGGAKVVTALEAALDLPADSLDVEREVLRHHGNMSAPTVLFVLHEVLARGATGQMVMTALGPGFTAAFLPFRVG